MTTPGISLHHIGRSGELRLTFERRDQRTVLIENYSRPPLQVMRAIPDAHGGMTVYLLSPTGGVVQGDRYDIDLRIGSGTHSVFTTQSATRIYRMPDGCAEQRTRIEVGEGAVFEYLPDAAILFAEADFRQQTEIIVHPGALLLLYDIVMPGRLAHGERLRFRRYASRLVVRKPNAQMLVYESSVLEPAREVLDGIGRLEGYSCWGSAYLLGDLSTWGIHTPLLLERAAPLVAAEHLPPQAGLAGISALAAGGMVVRALSHRLETIYSLFQAFRALARSLSYNLPDVPLRK